MAVGKFANLGNVKPPGVTKIVVKGEPSQTLKFVILQAATISPLSVILIEDIPLFVLKGYPNMVVQVNDLIYCLVFLPKISLYKTAANKFVVFFLTRPVL